MLRMMGRRALPLVAAMALALNAPAFAEDAAQPTQVAATAPNTVTIDNFAFAPAILAIAPGTRVTWTNKDEEPHTVTSVDGMFKSPALDTDDKFSFTFDKPGTYKYFCSIHPHMIGTIVVK